MNEWHDPKKELPNFGDWVVMRETIDITQNHYSHPIKEEFGRISYKVVLYSTPLQFDLPREAEDWNYRITHWMRIPPVEYPCPQSAKKRNG